MPIIHPERATPEQRRNAALMAAENIGVSRELAIDERWSMCAATFSSGGPPCASLAVNGEDFCQVHGVSDV